MLDNASMLNRAQNALEDLTRVTGIAYSAKPEIGAISLFADHRENVDAM